MSCPLQQVKLMTIGLAKDVEDFLQEQVRTGACDDASDFINDLVRSVKNQQLRPFVITPELEAWLLEAAEKPVTPLTEADFRSLRERVGARLRSSAA
jgi:Arc/MetJ-type ribon-helix-helix transcriptional regulator